MSTINIADAKKPLSSLLQRVQRGDVLAICHQNTPVAERRPMILMTHSPMQRTRHAIEPLALELGIPIVTPDTAILQYPIKTLWN